MRIVLLVVLAALLAAAAAAADTSVPTAHWLAQARCVHVREAPWTANTGNGYFGGMQFSDATWRRLGGPPQAAFAHPGDARFPLRASPAVQLHLAWLLWLRDGRSWRSWGAVGAACSG